MENFPRVYRTEALGLPIMAEVNQLGPDYLITIRGGSRHHIGSVSIAYKEAGQIRLKKILLPEHRDDVISDMAAVKLCEALDATVSAVCGIHYEAPGKDDIAVIVAAAEQLIRDICNSLVQKQHIPSGNISII